MVYWRLEHTPSHSHTHVPTSLSTTWNFSFPFYQNHFQARNFLQYVAAFQTSSAELKNHIVKLKAHIAQINGQQNYGIL